ncbi:MAG: UvrD-helicase domain-containing protein [Clostridiales bacterium]|nr:UvrD-helicase domain-containing protein [Clostridiales bacterium]
MDAFDNEYGDFDLIRDLEENLDQGSDDDLGSELLEGLNPEQKMAVEHLDGPLLILAGAGSGKTRVITYRIAYMMKRHHVAPSSILAITFTNKAANEMKERINKLVGDSSRYIWSGTFHSIFARILRRHAECLGFTSAFTIVDTDDQIKLIKQIMAELEIPEKLYKPRNFQFEISSMKNNMVSPEEYEQLAAHDTYRMNAAKVYKRYQTRLFENNSMDFDDILLYMVKLLKSDPEVLAFYQNKFKYIMVDEYQDTNKAQYMAVKLLSDAHKNICVVGDDDQSIYSFRGADVRMILSFEKDFKGAKVIKLEQNYRSTSNILDAANCVIKNNKSRKSKALRTDQGKGDPLILMNADSQQGEADFVSSTIVRLKESGKCDFNEIAILYRMNALSRSLETSLRQKGIPFKIYGGMRFYDRKEIKDVFAYLRVIADGRDNLAFERIINVPKRGIGDTTVDTVRELAIDNGVGCLTICRDAFDFPELSRSAGKLHAFYGLIETMREELHKNEKTFSEYIDYVENKSGIIDDVIAQRETKGELIDRVENLKELLTEAIEFEKSRRNAEDEPDLSAEDPYLERETRSIDTLEGLLSAYLETAALYASGDEDEEGDNVVKMMSIHSAKGLEFNSVFLIGSEEGIFPSYKCITSETDLEEERRLMYVAITRAKKNLFITLTRNRLLFGQTQCNAPSRFLREIPPELIYKMGSKREPVKPVEPPKPQVRVDSVKQISSMLSSGFSGTKKKESASSFDPSKLSVGVKVLHDRFGEGTIVKAEPVAGDCLVTIDFDGMTKNMLAKSAGLKIV